MEKLELIDLLLQKVSEGKIVIADTQETAGLLAQIYDVVWEDYKQEIRKVILDKETSYYAPDYASWHLFLLSTNRNLDYAKVMLHSFPEEYIEQLWQASHIAEDLSTAQIKEELISQIMQMKSLDTVGAGRHCRKDMELGERISAKINGLYQILYE